MEYLEALPVLTDDVILQFTQGTRKKFVAHILSEGFPEDTKSQNVLLTALADMDRAALGNKRIGAAERQTAADVLVAKTIARISEQYGQVNPFAAAESAVGVVSGTTPTIEPTRLPSANPAPGETDIGLCEGNYNSLMALFD
jgi:hypothetical protein